VGRWEGDLWAGRAKGSAGIFIDERADERQAEVLPRIFGGQVGGFPAFVARLFAEGRQIRGVERARITFEVAADRANWGTEIAGKVKVWAKALTGPTSLPGKYPQLASTEQIVELPQVTSCPGPVSEPGGLSAIGSTCRRSRVQGRAASGRAAHHPRPRPL
jgi:hypothetical protein